LPTPWSPPHRLALSLLTLLALVLVALWSWAQAQRPVPVSTLAWGPALSDRSVLGQGLLVRGRLMQGLWVVEADAQSRAQLREAGAWLTWPIPHSAARMPGCSGELPRLDPIHRAP